MGEQRGVLEVGTAEGVAREDRAALETLADQVALALETVARAREKADAERRHVRDLFSRFVPEAVVEEVLAQADGARLGGRALNGTIMFTDLRGFTTFSESRPAGEVIEVVNRILSDQTETIMAHGGTIIAYLGDGLMAAFGAPIEQPDHADRALAAARELIGATLPGLNAWMREQGYGDGFRMGIGVNSGSFISGNVGHERRLEYTAIGDVINTASRIEGLTKGTRHQLLFSDATREALTGARTTSSTSARARSAAGRRAPSSGRSRPFPTRRSGRECRHAGGADRRRAGPLALAHAAPGLEARARLGAARHLDVRRVARRGRAGRPARAARATRPRSGRGIEARPPTAVAILKPDHIRDVDLFVARYGAPRVRAAALLAGRHPGDRASSRSSPGASCPAGSSRSTTAAAATRRRSGCPSSGRSSSPTR